MANEGDKVRTRGQKVLETLLADTGLNATDFASYIDVSLGTIQDLSRGRTLRFSKRVIDAVVAKFPRYNRLWLLSAEGPKFVEGSVEVVNNVNTGKNIATGANASAGDQLPADIINRLLDELAAQRQQNQELIELLKKTYDGKSGS